MNKKIFLVIVIIVCVIIAFNNIKTSFTDNMCIDDGDPWNTSVLVI